MIYAIAVSANIDQKTMASMLFKSIDTITTKFVYGIFNTINAEYRQAILAAMTVYIVVYGLRLMSGSIQTPLLDAVKHLSILMIAVLIALKPDFVQKKIYQLTTNGTNHVTACLGASAVKNAMPGSKANLKCNKTGKADSNAGSFMIDTFGYQGLVITKAIMSKGGFTTFGWYIVGAAFFFAFALLFVRGVANLVEAKIGIAIFLALLPIFVILWAFGGPARDLFSGWLKQVLYFVVLQILTVLALVFIIFVAVGDMFSTESGAANFGDISYYFGMIIFMLLSYFFMQQVPGYSSALVTGTAGSGVSSTALAGGFAKGAAKGAVQTVNKAGQGVEGMWKVMKKMYRHQTRKKD